MIIKSILVLALLFATFFKTKRSLHMLQQNLYNENNRYLKWVFKNYKQFIDLDIILVVVAGLGAFLFSGLKTITTVGMILLILVGYLLGFAWVNRIKNDQNKKPLVVTARIKRLIFTISVLYFIPLVLMSYYMVDKEFFWLMLFVITVMIYLNQIVKILVHFLQFLYVFFLYIQEF